MEYLLIVANNGTSETQTFLISGEEKLADILKNMDKDLYSVIDIRCLGWIEKDYQILLKKHKQLEIGGDK
jgi:hypothetical protein